MLSLYVPGQGYWETVHDDGTRVAVRHVYDFDTIGRLLSAFGGAVADGALAQSRQLVPEPSGLVVWDRAGLNPAGQLTVTAWVNPVSWPGQYDQAPADGSIVSKAATSGAWFPATPPNTGYALSGSSGGAISFGAAVGGRFVEATSTASVPTGSWHHVAGTFDGKELAVYIDGQLAATTAAAGSLSPSAGTNLMVGADPINPINKLTGAVDEVRVYSRALSAAEIAALYAADDAAYGSDDSALELRLPLDEGRGGYTVDAVAGLEETIIAGRWVSGRYGSALSFAETETLTYRISRQQYNENNGASFSSIMLTDLFGYAPDGQRIALLDPATPVVSTPAWPASPGRAACTRSSARRPGW